MASSSRTCETLMSRGTIQSRAEEYRWESHILPCNSVGQDASSPENDKEFQGDLIEVMVKCAKKLKLRFVNRESITKRMNEIREEAKQYKESN